MQKTLMMLIMAALLFLSNSFETAAFDEKVLEEEILQEIIIDKDYHHIGDERSERMRNAEPEGTVWEKLVNLPGTSGFTTYITFMASGIECVDLLINDLRIAVPVIDPDNLNNDYRMHVISLPSFFLRKGRNKIGFTALQCKGNYDDFEFNDMVMYFK